MILTSLNYKKLIYILNDCFNLVNCVVLAHVAITIMCTWYNNDVDNKY